MMANFANAGAWPPPPLIPPHKGEGDDCYHPAQFRRPHRLPPPCGEGLRVGVGSHRIDLGSPYPISTPISLPRISSPISQ